MIGPDGAFAHWLGEVVEGKALREPINVIVVDERSTSADEAVDRIVAASTAAGYRIRTGHSTGYKGMIGGEILTQLPKQHDAAFSNEVFEISNNHGRLFGPYRFGSAYLFTGAFSREEVRVAQTPHHSFASFNQARDDYALNLGRKSEFKLSAFVSLDNAILGNPDVGTGDHDGIATLLRASK